MGEAFEDLNEVVNPDAFGLNADHETITRFWDRAQVRVPEFRAATPMGGYGSLYDMTPDGNPILDASEVVEGLCWAVGFSGTRIQAVPGSGPDGGGAGVARREQKTTRFALSAQVVSAEGDLSGCRASLSGNHGTSDRIGPDGRLARELNRPAA